MDCHDTIGAIHEREGSRALPIITLPAKVMKGDREKRIGAGATDHGSKRVDPEHLLAVLRAWLQASGALPLR